MPEISIIIPCYNVEKYIDRCLESVTSQTIGLDMLEIIVINDASTDHTLDKLFQWEKRFPDNILVITYEENLRQGGARNIGLQHAKGQYIGFVDADDWIDKDMFRLLYEKMKVLKVDVVKCKWIRESYPGQYAQSEEDRHDVEYTFTPKEGLYYGRVTECGNCGSYGHLVTGLYRKTLISEHDIYFPEQIAYEDNYFASILNLYIGSLYIVDKAMYHYFMNPTSTIMLQNASHHLDRMKVELMLIEAFRDRGALEGWHDEIEFDFLNRFYINTLHIIFTRFSYIPDVFQMMKKSILQLFPNYKNNPHIIAMEECTFGKQMLRLLEIDHEICPEELAVVRDAYLKVKIFA